MLNIMKKRGNYIFFQIIAEKNLSLFYSIYILNFVIVTHNLLVERGHAVLWLNMT